MLLVFSACQIWTLFTSHLHMYMPSAYYLSICVLCAYYLQWSFICSFLTDNANVIYMSSLVLFIDPYMLHEFIYSFLNLLKYFSETFSVAAAMVVECAQTTVCLNGGVCVSDDSTNEPAKYGVLISEWGGLFYALLEVCTNKIVPWKMSV